MQTQFNKDLIHYLNTSPTPFHAVENLVNLLEDKGAMRLMEEQTWTLQAGKTYYLTRNGSSIVAFHLADENFSETPCRIVGAHTDSPNLKIKPNAVRTIKNYVQLGVEVYGGALLNPWFDRDLSIAGRVNFVDESGQLQSRLIDFQRAIGIIPSLAIHLDREVNKNRCINEQTDLPVILQLENENSPFNLNELLKQQILLQYSDSSVDKVLSFDLSFYDTQSATIVGLQEDFICSARLDNLLSCFCGLRSLMDVQSPLNCIFVANDHEEVGSASHTGAQGPFLKSVMQRLSDSTENYYRGVENALMVSADNAHGVHPNFVDKHDENHGPILNAGPVIKINANQRYATDGMSSAFFELACQQANVPVQKFTMRSDMACGSTIGPITATQIGVKTVDVGVPTFAMHSTREVAGSQDTLYLYQALQQFYQQR